MWKGLIVLSILLVAVTADSINVQYNGDLANRVDVKTYSEIFYVTASEAPNGTTITITITSANASDFSLPGAPLTITPSTITLDPTTLTGSFRVLADAPVEYVLNFTVSGERAEDIQYDPIPAQFITFKNRTWVFSPDMNTVLKVNIPSEPVQVAVSTPSTDDLSLAISFTDSTISISPSTIVIKAHAATGYFTLTGSQVGYDLSAVNVSCTLTGTEQALYDVDQLCTTMQNAIRSFQINYRELEIIVPANFDISFFVGNASSGLAIYTEDFPDADSTVAFTVKTSSDSVITPDGGVQQLSSAKPYGFYQVNTNADSIYAQKDFFVISESPYYPTLSGPISVSVPKRDITVTVPQVFIPANISYMTISIPGPLNAGDSLRVTFSSGHFRFNYSVADDFRTGAVIFSGLITSFIVEMTPEVLGEDFIIFELSDPNPEGLDTASFFNDPPFRAVYVGKADIVVGYYLPKLWVGRTSDPIPIHVTRAPNTVNGTTVVPSAPNLLFTPSSITFTNGGEEQFFTITPLYSNSAQGFGYSTEINWFVLGPDAAIYNRPASIDVEVTTRVVQVKWSHHLVTDDHDYYSGSTKTERYLHKTYKVWASVNYIGAGEEASITPVSAYFTFSPATLFFDGSRKRVLFEATVTGINSAASIDYILGGKDGGLFLPQSESFATLPRPLNFVAAEISLDERTAPIWIVRDARGEDAGRASNFESTISNKHMYSFLLRSFVLPDKDLTITPRCEHATFSPSSITIDTASGVRRVDYGAAIALDPSLEISVSNSSSTYDDFNVANGTFSRTYYFAGTGIYLEANFSVKAEAAGTHDVWFELSGSDAPYYNRPGHRDMTFNLVMRPETERYATTSSSSFLLPSALAVVMAIFALAM